MIWGTQEEVEERTDLYLHLQFVFQHGTICIGDRVCRSVLETARLGFSRLVSSSSLSSTGVHICTHILLRISDNGAKGLF